MTHEYIFPLAKRWKACALVCLSLALSSCTTVDTVRGTLSNRFSSTDISSAQPNTETARTSSLIADIEQGLATLGYDPGVVDDKKDARTEAAIQDFQLDQNLRIDGKATKKLLAAVNRELGSR